MRKTNSRQVLAMNLERLMATTPGMDSHSAVARAAKLAHSHIGRILRQESSITLDALDDLAAAFGLHTWEMLTDSEETKRAALEKMMFGQAVPDSRVEEALPPAPTKVVAFRRRKGK